ncbi:hypothetical protein LOC51_43500, partial [Rubrivivax sp. JA1024]|nr:hypothetical protein [Rubrivivax sp. JA1024]
MFVVMAGLDPRLSGLRFSYGEAQLSLILNDRWRFEQGVDGAPMHEVGADEAAEGQQAADSTLSGMSEAQQQEG